MKYLTWIVVLFVLSVAPNLSYGGQITLTEELVLTDSEIEAVTLLEGLIAPLQLGCSSTLGATLTLTQAEQQLMEELNNE